MFFAIQFKNGRVDVNILIKQMEMAMPPDVARPCVEAANKCSGLRKFSFTK